MRAPKDVNQNFGFKLNKHKQNAFPFILERVCLLGPVVERKRF